VSESHVHLCLWLVPSHLTCLLWTRNRWIACCWLTAAAGGIQPEQGWTIKASVERASDATSTVRSALVTMLCDPFGFPSRWGRSESWYAQPTKSLHELAFYFNICALFQSTPPHFNTDPSPDWSLGVFGVLYILKFLFSVFRIQNLLVLSLALVSFHIHILCLSTLPLLLSWPWPWPTKFFFSFLSYILCLIKLIESTRHYHALLRPCLRRPVLKSKRFQSAKSAHFNRNSRPA